MTAGEQARAVLYMMAVGAAVGMLYDVQNALKMGRIMDLLLGVWAALGMTGAALFLRINPFRFYVFAGTGAGIALYFLTFGAIFRSVFRAENKKYNN